MVEKNIGKTAPPALNSKEYWENRFKGSWREKQGEEQTRFHAELLYNHLPEWFIQDVRQRKLSLCDWGCAEGEAVAYFSQVFTNNALAGVDFAENAIRNARQKFPKQQFEAADWLAGEAKAPQYDVIVTSHVLEHFHEAIRILRDVLGQAARKYLVVLVPFNEDPEHPDPEHCFRFLKTNLPMAWEDWFCVYFKIVPPPPAGTAPWRNEQAVIVYARRTWLQKNAIELTLANYPGDTQALGERARLLERQLADTANALGERLLTLTRQAGEAEKAQILAEQKFETQLVHDQILLNSNTQLNEESHALREELRRASERTAELERLREEEIPALTRQVAELEKAAMIAEQKLETQLLHDQILLKSNNTLQEENDLLREERRKGVERLDELERERNQLAGQANELQNSKTQHVRELENLARQLQTREEYATELRQQLEESQRGQQALNAAQAILAAQAAENAGRTAELEKFNERLNAEKAAAEGQRSRAEAEAQQLDHQVTGLKQYVFDLERQTQHLKQEQEILERENQPRRLENERLLEKANELEAHNERLAAEQSRTAEEWRGALAQNAELAGQLEKQQAELSRIRQQQAQTQKDGERLKQEIAGLEEEAGRSRQRLAELEERTEQLALDKERLLEAQTQLQAVCDQIEERNHWLEQEKNRLEAAGGNPRAARP